MTSYNSYQRTNSTSNNERNYFLSTDQRMGDFEKFIRRYESTTISLSIAPALDVSFLVNKTFAKKLLGLDGYEIVFICDDSGSMNTPLG